MEEKKFDILKLFQLIFALSGMLIAVYSYVTENYDLAPVILIFLSLMYLVIGLREYKRTKNLQWGVFYLCVSLLVLFCAFSGI